MENRANKKKTYIYYCIKTKYMRHKIKLIKILMIHT